MPLLVAPFLTSYYISGIFHRFVVTLRLYKVHSKLEFHIQFYFFLLYKFRLNVLFGKLMCVGEGENLIFTVSFTLSLPLYFWLSRDREGSFKKKGQKVVDRCEGHLATAGCLSFLQ